MEDKLLKRFITKGLEYKSFNEYFVEDFNWDEFKNKEVTIVYNTVVYEGNLLKLSLELTNSVALLNTAEFFPDTLKVDMSKLIKLTLLMFLGKFYSYGEHLKLFYQLGLSSVDLTEDEMVIIEKINNNDYMKNDYFILIDLGLNITLNKLLKEENA